MRESDFRVALFFLLGDLQAKFTLKKSKPTGKYYTKGRIIIIQISKEEAHALHEGHNVPWKDNGISTSRSKHGKKYYLCEHYKNLQALNEIRGIKPRKNKPNFKNKRVGV